MVFAMTYYIYIYNIYNIYNIYLYISYKMMPKRCMKIEFAQAF